MAVNLEFFLTIILICASAFGIWLWLRARSLRLSTGLPKGRVVYSDTRHWQPCESLYSSRYGLVGKPDYIVERGRQIIPVEVKPSRRATEPYESDVMQLAAYCLLVEDLFDSSPSHGLLRYRDQTFAISFDRSLRSWLLRQLEEMRHSVDQCQVDRSHQDSRRCEYCGQAEHCAQRLVD